MAESDGGEFTTIMIVLLVGIIIVYFVIQRNSQATSQQTIVSGPLNASQVPNSLGENVETATAASIPFVGPIVAPFVNYAQKQPGASITPQITVGSTQTHTDTAGQQQVNQHTGFLYVGIGNKSTWTYIKEGADKLKFWDW